MRPWESGDGRLAVDVGVGTDELLDDLNGGDGDDCDDDVDEEDAAR